MFTIDQLLSSPDLGSVEECSGYLADSPHEVSWHLETKDFPVRALHRRLRVKKESERKEQCEDQLPYFGSENLKIKKRQILCLLLCTEKHKLKPGLSASPSELSTPHITSI